MPWEKQFDRRRALERAMALFWKQGYEATSVQDLVSELGVNRGSLYATFGDKRSLFIEALRLYDDEYRLAFTRRLSSGNPGRNAIVDAFQQVVVSARGGSREGCFLVNTALELSPHDDEIGGIVSRALGQVERFFAEMIEVGKAEGEIPSRVPTADTSRALLSLFVGLRALSRTRPRGFALSSIVRQAEAMLA